MGTRALLVLSLAVALAGCGGRHAPGEPTDGGHPGDGFTPQDAGPWPHDAPWPYDAWHPYDAPWPYDAWYPHDAPWPYDAWHPYDAPWPYDAWHPYDAPWPYDAWHPYDAWSPQDAPHDAWYPWDAPWPVDAWQPYDAPWPYDAQTQRIWCGNGTTQMWCVVDSARCCVYGSAPATQCLPNSQPSTGCDLVAWCDGPEDCYGGNVCCITSSVPGEAACRPAPCAGGQRLCHMDAHCGAGQRCCTSYAFGWGHGVCVTGSVCPP